MRFDSFAGLTASSRRLLAVGGLLVLCLFGAVSCKRLASLGKPPPVFGRPRVDAAFREMADEIAKDPKFKEELAKGSKSPDTEKLDLAIKSTGNRELGAQLAAKGAARLDAKEFLEMIKLKLKLAEASPKLCTGFWSGGLAGEDFAVGLDALSDPDLHRWFQLSARAMRLQLYATTPLPRFAGQALTDGIGEIKSTLPPEASDTLSKTMTAGVAAPPAAACQAYLQLTRGALRLPDAQRDAFLRAMTFDTLVDW
jgi:hypothetical protein